MRHSSKYILILLAALFAAAPAFAAGEGEDLDLVGHTADGVYLEYEPFGVIELPRLFLVKDEHGAWGFDAFWSTAAALRSGQYVVVLHEQEGVHGEGEHPEAAPLIVDDVIHAGDHLHAAVVPVHGEIVLDFSITRHLVYGMLAALLVLLVFIPLAGRYKRGVGRDTAPRGIFQNMFEGLVVFVRDEIARPNIGDKYPKYLPYLLTAFFFVLFSNLLGIVPYGAAATSNIAVTGMLALFTFVIGHVHASKDYWKHIFWPPGIPVAIKLILIPVEFIGMFTKHIALAIRLFANMAAGSLIILSLIGLIFIFNGLFGSAVGWGVTPVSVALTLFISVVKLLVAFIQAYVFTMLSALFIGMAVEEHHADEGHLPELHVDQRHATPVIDHQGGVPKQANVHVTGAVPAH